MVLALLTLLSLGEAKERVYQTPPYLPRYAAFELIINPPSAVHPAAISPALRLGWEIDLIQGQRDVLAVIAELGLAYTSINADLPFFWQYTAILGIGYRNQRDSGLYWGFSIGGGPIYYGYKLESRWDIYTEGRLMIGWRIGPLTLTFAGGYGQWLAYNPFSVAQQFAGGPFVGTQLGWK
jgi:hypothetical protein